MPHKDPVTPDVYNEVMSRDTIQRWGNLMRWYQIDPDDLPSAMDMFRTAQENPCVAQTLDPLGSGPCSGQMTLDHVHRHAGGTKGKRAPSDPEHLVVLCYGHHQESRKGSIWATAHRPLLREYLEAIYGPEVSSDANA
jgi:hypothetical protein